MDAKPKRRRFRFSLRTLLVLMTIVCAGFGWLGMKVRAKHREREVVEAIREKGGPVYYDFQWSNARERFPTPPGPAFLRTLLGDDIFADVVVVDCRSETTNADLKDIANFTRLRGLGVAWTKVTDAGLVHLAELKELEWLNLAGTEVTDNGLVHLKGLTRLSSLYLGRTEVTDAGLVHLNGLTKLEWLALSETKVTDEGVEKLHQALPNLNIIR